MIKFWLVCSEYQRSMLVSSVFVLAIFIGQAIHNSSSVTLSAEGLAITKTAIANQAQLEQSLLLIELQQKELTEIKNQAIALKQRTGVGGKLVNDLDNLEAKFPPEYVKELEQTIEQSESVLNPDSNYDTGN